MKRRKADSRQHPWGAGCFECAAPLIPPFHTGFDPDVPPLLHTIGLDPSVSHAGMLLCVRCEVQPCRRRICELLRHIGWLLPVDRQEALVRGFARLRGRVGVKIGHHRMSHPRGMGGSSNPVPAGQTATGLLFFSFDTQITFCVAQLAGREDGSILNTPLWQVGFHALRDEPLGFTVAAQQGGDLELPEEMSRLWELSAYRHLFDPLPMAR